MKVDITIDEKSLSSIVSFDLADFSTPKSYKDTLAIIMMIAADYSLDPELELEDLENIVNSGKENNDKKVVFVINEDEIEAELSK